MILILHPFVRPRPAPHLNHAGARFISRLGRRWHSPSGKPVSTSLQLDAPFPRSPDQSRHTASILCQHLPKPDLQVAIKISLHLLQTVFELHFRGYVPFYRSCECSIDGGFELSVVLSEVRVDVWLAYELGGAVLEIAAVS